MNNISKKGQFSHIFYNNLRFLIKLWIINTRYKPWNDLIIPAKKTETKAKIFTNTHLDQGGSKGNYPIKIKINSCNQLEKAHKLGTTLLG